MTDLNRRQFLQKSLVGSAAAGLAASTLRSHTAFAAVPANDRITVGMIGVGARAQGLISAIQGIDGIEITGVCDAYTGRIQRTLSRLQAGAKQYSNYREMLDDPGIDTVVISTPDHQHKNQIIAALQAGKDVYSEKPLTYTVDEGVDIVNAVKQSGQILQTGSQGMSSTIQNKAREIIRSGRLGQITLIRASYNRNTASGAWIYPIPPDASPATVNWNMFLSGAPRHPFSLERFFRWRCYRDYSGGIATDLFVHLCTTIHYIMGATVPSMAIGAGQLYRWKESRDVPDTINGILEYPEGFTVNLSSTFNNASSPGSGFQILGTEGSMTLGGTMTLTTEHPVENNGWIVKSWPKALEDDYWNDPEVQKREKPDSWSPATYTRTESIHADGPDATLLHMQHFFDCVRSRRQPRQDAAAGHHAAACAHMINMSIDRKQPVYWDYKKDTVKKLT